MRALYTITSVLHNEVVPKASEEKFIKEIEAALGCCFEHHEDDFSTYGTADESYIYVRTGGTEGIFKGIFCKDGVLRIPGRVMLLTSGLSNSLAASMEILSYLRNNGIPGEIIHGTPEQIASRIISGGAAPFDTVVETLKPCKVLEGERLGVVGHPSDWLISSDVDYRKAYENLGVELVDIPMQELLDEFHALKDVPELPFELNPLNAPKYGKPFAPQDFPDALKVYGALKKLVSKYRLTGLTIRCFGLLTSIHNTGCMALAILNAEGITATCEGDVPAMLTMAAARRICNVPAFQVNLARTDGHEFNFAHCTIPLNMVKSYVYETHFESGFGVAVHGELETGDATVFKIGAGADRFMVKDVQLTGNKYGANLCRTQIVIETEGLQDYFLKESLGNHHIVLLGHHAEEIKKAFAD